jgi:hypothetical protein
MTTDNIFIRLFPLFVFRVVAKTNGTHGGVSLENGKLFAGWKNVSICFCVAINQRGKFEKFFEEDSCAMEGFSGGGKMMFERVEAEFRDGKPAEVMIFLRFLEQI